ncbi:MAG: dockerin type I domain-containing protein, partial [Planctomycetota bacterium]
MVGWRDSDGDGIFDVLDVPLSLDALGRYDEASGNLLIQGTATVDTLANLNSSGTQSDITLARISELQYRVDDGQWQTALAPNATSVDFDLQIPIPDTFDRIEFRAIDTSTTNTSDTLVSTAEGYLFSGNGGGVTYLDANENGVRDPGESWLEGVGVTLVEADQSPLYSADVDAALLPDGEIAAIDGLTLTAVGPTLDGRVGALESSTLGPTRTLQALHQGGSVWIDTWNEDNRLVVESDTDVGRFVVDFVALDTGGYGVEEGSFARVEAFDRNGVPIERVTSQMVAAGESGQVIIEDTAGRIARIEIYGHAETEILISAVRAGNDASSLTDAGGGWAIDGLADGTYGLAFETTNITIAFPLAPSVEVADGKTEVAVGAIRVDSARHNAVSPGDVNSDGDLAPRDALAVINDIARLGPRTLTTNELTGPFVDVSNDGFVTALDALLVINLLQRGSDGEGEDVQSAHSSIFRAIGNASADVQNPVVLGPNLDENPIGMADSAGKPDDHQSTGSEASDSTVGASDQASGSTDTNRDATLESSLRQRIFARLRHYKRLFEGGF